MPARAEQVDAVRRLVRESVQAVDALVPPAMRAVVPALVQARDELRSDLQDWLATAKNGADRFTAADKQAALRSLEGALDRIKDLHPAMASALAGQRHATGPLAIANLDNEIRRLSAIFGGGVPVIPNIKAAAIIAQGDKLLWKRHETSAKRYAGAIGEDIKHLLAVGVAKGESFDQLVNRLRRIGSAGRTARPIEPGTDSAEIAGGLFGRYRWWAERLVRTECLPGSALVDSAVVTAVHRRWHEGPMAEVVTEGGRKLSATPNHPMLTRRGWVGAGDLREGDYLVRRPRDKYAGPTRDEHVDHGPATIAQVYDAISAVGVGERRRTAQPDFHGDGADGYVDIFCPRGPLAIGAFAALFEPLRELFLAESDGLRAPFCPQCGRLLSVDKQACCRRVPSDDTGICQPLLDEGRGDPQVSSDPLHALAGCVPFDDALGRNVVPVSRVRPSSIHEGMARLAETSRDASSPNYAGNRAAAAAEQPRDVRRALAGEVELDRVVSVKIRSFRGHVFNLSTPYGYYTINGYYTGNTMNTYNVMHDESIAYANENRPDGDEEYLRRWDAAADARVCPTCAGLDGKVTTLDGAFPGGYSSPPAHPICRCTTLAWLRRWGDMKGETQINGPVPTPGPARPREEAAVTEHRIGMGRIGGEDVAPAAPAVVPHRARERVTEADAEEREWQARTFLAKQHAAREEAVRAEAEANKPRGTTTTWQPGDELRRRQVVTYRQKTGKELDDEARRIEAEHRARQERQREAERKISADEKELMRAARVEAERQAAVERERRRVEREAQDRALGLVKALEAEPRKGLLARIGAAFHEEPMETTRRAQQAAREAATPRAATLKPGAVRRAVSAIDRLLGRR